MPSSRGRYAAHRQSRPHSSEFNEIYDAELVELSPRVVLPRRIGPLTAVVFLFLVFATTMKALEDSPLHTQLCVVAGLVAAYVVVGLITFRICNGQDSS